MAAQERQLGYLYDVASQDFGHYMKQAGRDPQELKIRMRHVKERSIPLRRVQDFAIAINDKIDYHTKRLTLTACEAVCNQATEKLPPKIRDEIYHYLATDLSKHELPLDLAFSYNLAKVIDVPQMYYWLKEKSIPAFEIMQIWLGRTFALEFIAVRAVLKYTLRAD